MDTLQIDTVKTYKTVSEAFGMSEKLYDRIHKSMVMFFGLAQVDEMKTHGEKGHVCGGNKAKRMAKYLASKEFAKLKWTPKTANDFFVLGTLFIHANRTSEQMIHKFVEEKIGDTIGGLLGKAGVRIEVVHGK